MTIRIRHSDDHRRVASPLPPGHAEPRTPLKFDEPILPKLRAVFLSATEDGLFAANRAMLEWVRGHVTHRFVGTRKAEAIHLIDFDEGASNKFVVSDEVVFVGADTRRYDLVLWINGFPVVVGETKTPLDESRSWLDAAVDIHATYEARTPAFFVANALSFACDGKEFRYGAIGQAPEHWLPWSRTTDPIREPSLGGALRSAALLLRPRLLLDIIQVYTFFIRKATADGALAAKILPRYPQVESVEAIVERAHDQSRSQGLIWHHQGSGKTLLMAFAAAKLRMESSELNAPTIVVVLDRIDLLDQLHAEFRAVGIKDLVVAETGKKLHRVLANGQGGVVVTTVFRFANAGLLTNRSNIVVMVDEAHRTQDGRLGADLKAALPNATRIGLTGTPISQADRDTWNNFGHSGDPGNVLNHYSVERSINDGATLPVHVETRLVDYQIASAITVG
ncbi:DEAD/DEAH box helicase family protein [Micromonospora sediminimaris]|uniref:DEAD/DEAH box helicase family protein n=1 Tax=Micromonospora sediminimaris TaxID=547162 RepID=UPI0037951537